MVEFLYIIYEKWKKFYNRLEDKAPQNLHGM